MEIVNLYNNLFVTYFVTGEINKKDQFHGGATRVEANLMMVSQLFGSKVIIIAAYIYIYIYIYTDT